VFKHFAKSDTYLMPTHILEQVASLVKALSEDTRDESGWRADPCPVCIHDVAIVRCDDCCSVLAHQVAHLSGPRLWAWCDANLLRVVA